MKITFLTPGTGSYYCGACMRDNVLANALIEAGYEAELLPMYLPLMLDDDAQGLGEDTPIFFGGINIFLQHKFSLFRHSPRWMDRLLNQPGLLRSVAKRSHMTSAHDHGAMTLEMLQLNGDVFKKELGKLYSWIEDHGRPQAMVLSTALQAGFAREIKARWDIPVVCCFQGEDSFLDSLPDRYRESCWDLMKTRSRDADKLLAPSRFYAKMMEDRLELPEGTIGVQYNGINLEGFLPHKSVRPPAIGYLARMCEVKGLGFLVDAFIYLRTVLGNGDCQLKVAGAMTQGDEAFVKSLKEKLREAGLEKEVHWYPNISREEKMSYLNGLSLFSVPVQYKEAFGLYAIEAMAASVAIVQPNDSAFPEIVELAGGGVCADLGHPQKLAETWNDLLKDPDHLESLGKKGRLGVEERFSMQAMKNAFVDVIESLLQSKSS